MIPIFTISIFWWERIILEILISILIAYSFQYFMNIFNVCWFILLWYILTVLIINFSYVLINIQSFKLLFSLIELLDQWLIILNHYIDIVLFWSNEIRCILELYIVCIRVFLKHLICINILINFRILIQILVLSQKFLLKWYVIKYFFDVFSCIFIDLTLLIILHLS